MLRFKRPKPPDDFAASVRDAARDVQIAIARRAEPAFDERIWKKHKEAFIVAQHGKCAYCEQYSMNHPGSVDHYAPKSEVHDLIADGEEEEHTASISPKSRKTRLLCTPGYWWLAYDWNNWLFACERCNSAWKKCLFPVRKKSRTLPPHPGVKETPLLLNPFGRVDPEHHLRFNALGEIVAHEGSDRGEATIRTCGLDRGSLRQARKGIAGDVHRHITALLTSVNSGDHRRAIEAIQDLLSLGASKRPHAGMVRSIVRSELKCDWSQLPTLSKLLAGPKRKRA